MNRTTRTVNTPNGPVLLSPVLANSVARGDMIFDFLVTGNQLRRVTRVQRVGEHVRLLIEMAHKPVEVDLNRSLLRAVGATVAGTP